MIRRRIRPITHMLHVESPRVAALPTGRRSAAAPRCASECLLHFAAVDDLRERNIQNLAIEMRWRG